MLTHPRNNHGTRTQQTNRARPPTQHRAADHDHTPVPTHPHYNRGTRTQQTNRGRPPTQHRASDHDHTPVLTHPSDDGNHRAQSTVCARPPGASPLSGAHPRGCPESVGGLSGSSGRR
ncbi:hypothetical protein GCM10009531_18710 [Actinoplanes capillaceus]